MKCPVCNIELKRFEIEHIELDLCEKCEGVWFDKDELLTVLKVLEKDPTIPYDKYNPFTKKAQIIDPRVYTKRSCPRCGKTMEEFNYSYDSSLGLNSDVLLILQKTGFLLTHSKCSRFYQFPRQ